MHHLETDEKLCPFCAEVIKAAAVKCRYCHSDLKPVAEAPTHAPAPAPEVATEPRPLAPGPLDREPDGVHGEGELPSFHEARSEPHGLLVSPVLTVVLALVLVVLAFVGVRLWMLDRADGRQVRGLVAPTQDGADRSERALAEVTGGVVTSDTAKTAGLVAATNAVQRVLSYSAPTLAKDKAAAEALLTGQVRQQYAATMARIEGSTLENQVKVEATVVAASIITATDHDASALLFVNQTTTSKTLRVPRVDQNRVVVTLHRSEGEWVVTDLNAL